MPSSDDRPTQPSPTSVGIPAVDEAARRLVAHLRETGARARVFSGIQPSGELHIGNYLGATRGWARQVAEGAEDAMFCIVDAHAITGPFEPAELSGRTLALATDLIACGIDPARCILFVQSDVREHTELAWYLASVTPKGDLERMTQFKDKSEGKDFASTALFTYPVLMSADILLYKATVVPVGEDQLQHLELARETVRRFNYRYGPIFPEPKARMSVAPRIMGLDGDGKMSKSKNNSIALFEEPDAFWNKLRGAFTDPQRLRKSDPGRPEVCNIYTMHKAMSPPETVTEVHASCTGAKWGCVDCKKVLFENFDRELVPLRAKRKELQASPDAVKRALGEGAGKARLLARETMTQVRTAMGLGSGSK
jgi:tryptophanyl-tRNA synthetase